MSTTTSTSGSTGAAGGAESPFFLSIGNGNSLTLQRQGHRGGGGVVATVISSRPKSAVQPPKVHVNHNAS